MITIQYAGSYIYENSSLKFVNHAEGYMEPDGGGGYDYVYQYKDHLGNVRLSYSDSNGDGVVDVNEIMSEKHYYPFGLQHRGYNSQIQGTYHPYGFNGKEGDSNGEWGDRVIPDEGGMKVQWTFKGGNREAGGLALRTMIMASGFIIRRLLSS